MGVVFGCVLQKWHPDKLKEEDSATSRFQEINEAYQGFCFSFALSKICTFEEKGLTSFRRKGLIFIFGWNSIERPIYKGGVR